MIKYSYKITKFNVNPKTEVLTSVEWWFVGKENEFSHQVFNTTIFDKPADKLIPLKEISEKDAIKFIENSLDKDYIKAMKSIIKEEIEKQKAPESVLINPPWTENN